MPPETAQNVPKCYTTVCKVQALEYRELLHLRYDRRQRRLRAARQLRASLEPLPAAPTTTAPAPPPSTPTGAVPSWFLPDIECIHSHEGAWNDNTGNGYYGGLQMDYSFQQTYGPSYLAAYGTANNWPVADQIEAAWRAYQVRGWSPWPNTSAMCGL